MKEKEFHRDNEFSLLKSFKENLETFQLPETTRLLVAISGGADSTCLLHLLSRTIPKKYLTAVYINHSLRPEEALLETKHIKTLCDSWEISFTHSTVDVPSLVKQEKLSTEDAARILRYKELERIRVDYNCDHIVTGHNSDDQVEEFFIRLIRGTNSTGLSGIRKSSGAIIRPLLKYNKQELTDYLEKNAISYCHDSSNDDTSFLRNKIRLSLLPDLENNYNNSIRKTVSQVSAILKEEDDFVHIHTKEVIDQILNTVDNSCELELGEFTSLHKAIQRRVIEHICWKMKSPPTYRLIELAIDTILTGKRGAEVHLKNGLRAIKQHDSILFYFPHGEIKHRKSTQNQKNISLEIDRPGKVFIEELNKTLTLDLIKEKNEKHEKTMIVDADSFDFPLSLSTPKPGQRFHPLGMKGKKKINRFLSDKKIEKHRRQDYLVLQSKTKVIAIPGLQIDDTFKVSDNTRSFLTIIWE